MAFRNFDNYYQDYDYDSDPCASPPFRRSGSSLPSRTPRRRANSPPPRSTRPIIGDDGWEVLPAELLDPSNWGLPPSSLSNTPEKADHRTDQEPKMYPGGTSRMFPGSNMGGGLMQFYPDHDPDLINTNQLDGMPYVLQSSNIPSTINSAPKVVVNAAYNASGGPKKMSLSQRWEQGLLEMAHSNPETLRNYSRILSDERGGFKSFGELTGDDEGEQGGVGSSGGAVPGPNFSAFKPSRGRGQTPASTPGHSSGLPGQPLTSGAGGSTPGFTSGGPCQHLSSGQPLGGSGRGRGRGNSLPTIHETPRTLGGGFGSAASSKAAARDAALRRDAATKMEQMRNKAELKREEYMKEITQREKAAAKKAKLEEEEAEKEKEKERVKLEKLGKDREARSRKEREWGKKSRDVRSLAAEAAARRDAVSIQKEQAESKRERREREEREKEERASARAQKKREEEEEEVEEYRLAMEKRQRDVEARNAKAREVEVRSKDARQLARVAAERRFAAMEREKQAEDRSKPAPATKVTAKVAQADKLVCEDCGKLFASEAQASVHADKDGHQNFAEIKPGAVKPAAKPSPAPAPGKKATPAPTASSVKAAAKGPERKSPPSRLSPAKAPAKAPTSEPTGSDEEKLTPLERVRLAMARHEAAIRALPAEEPSSGEEEVVTPSATPKPTAAPAKAPTRGIANPSPAEPAPSKSKAAMSTAPKARHEAWIRMAVQGAREDERRVAAAEAKRAKQLEEKAKRSAEKIEEQLESFKKPSWEFGELKKRRK